MLGLKLIDVNERGSSQCLVSPFATCRCYMYNHHGVNTLLCRNNDITSRRWLNFYTVCTRIWNTKPIISCVLWFWYCRIKCAFHIIAALNWRKMQIGHPHTGDTGPCFDIKSLLSGISISILKIRRSWDCVIFITLRWRHNDYDGVSNHQPHGCLLNRLFTRKSKKTSTLRVTGLCVGNSPGPVNSPHKGPVTRKMFPFDDVIMMGNPMMVRWYLYISLSIIHINTASRFRYSVVKSDTILYNDDVIKWKHFPCYWPFVRGIHQSQPVNSPHKGHWRGALIFPLICARIFDWVNNREAGDLRRHRAHYDVTATRTIEQRSYLEVIKCVPYFILVDEVNDVTRIKEKSTVLYWHIYQHLSNSREL